MSDLILLRCMDDRHEGEWNRLLRNTFQNSGGSLSRPGSALHLIPRYESTSEVLRAKGVLDDIAEALVLAETSNLVLLHHGGECKAYKRLGYTFSNPEEERTFHTKQLHAAKCVIEKALPDISVRCYYLNFQVKKIEDVSFTI